MKLVEFKDRARAGIEGCGLASKRKVRWKLEGDIGVNGLSLEDELGDVAITSIDLEASIDLDRHYAIDHGGMEASRAKIDEWPSMPEALEGFEPGELVDLFGPSTTPAKRKGTIVRPDVPHVDVRFLPMAGVVVGASMERSRAKLAADFADMPDEDE